MAEKKPAKGSTPNILTPDVPANSSKPRSLNSKFQPKPLTNTLGSDPENLSKIDEIRHLARQREAEAKTLGPNYVPEQSVEKTTAPVIRSGDDGTIDYTPSDLSRKYNIRNRALAPVSVDPARAAAAKRKDLEDRTYGRIAPVLASDINSRQVSTIGRAFDGTPEQLEARRRNAAAEYDRVNAVKIGNARQVHSVVFPGHPFPGLTEHENMLQRREAAIKTDAAMAAHSNMFPGVPWPGLKAHTQMVNDLNAKKAQESEARARARQLTEKPVEPKVPTTALATPAPSRPLLVLTGEQIKEHGVDKVNSLMKTHDVHIQLGDKHIGRIISTTEEFIHKPSGQQIINMIPINSQGIQMGPDATQTPFMAEGEVQNPIYRHGVSLFNKYAPRSKRFPDGVERDNVPYMDKHNWVRDHLKNKVVPSLYPDNEAAAYKELAWNHPDKIVDAFEEHHTKQKAFEAAHRKGGVLPTIPTDKIDPATGENKRRPPRAVHIINKEIRRLKNTNIGWTGPELDDPAEVAKQKRADRQALVDSTDLSGFSEQNTNPEAVAQSPEEAKSSKLRAAANAPLQPE